MLAGGEMNQGVKGGGKGEASKLRLGARYTNKG